MGPDPCSSHLEALRFRVGPGVACLGPVPAENRPLEMENLRPTLEAVGAIAVVIFVVFLLLESFLLVAEPAPEASILVRLTAVIAGGVLGAIAGGWMMRRHADASLETVRAEMASARSASNRNQALLEALLESSPAGVFLLDHKKRIVASNQLAADVHGATDILGHVCRKAFGQDSGACKTCAVTKSRAENAVHADALNSVIRKTGETIRRTARPLELPDWGHCTLVVDEIVTDQQKLQATLVHQEKMAAVGLLAAGISHDMGNPLSSIQMHLQLLEGESLPEQAAESLAFVRQGVNRLHRSIRELVDFARRPRNEAALVSVQSVVHDTLRFLRYDRRLRNVDVTVDADPAAPAVFIVEDHLVQVFLNLIINALDAMPDGGALHIELGSVGSEISLRIRDTGVGLAPQVLSRCYEPLFTTKAVGKGTGLGLSISREILQAAGGDVELHSREGQGATAIVRLPIAQETDAAEAASSTPTIERRAPNNGSARGLRVVGQVSGPAKSEPQRLADPTGGSRHGASN